MTEKMLNEITAEVLYRLQKRCEICPLSVGLKPKREGLPTITIENAYDINFLSDGVRYAVVVRSRQSREDEWPKRDYFSMDDYDIVIHQCWPKKQL